MENKTVILRKPTKEDKFWLDIWYKLKEIELQRFEESAKYLSGIIAATLTIIQVNSDKLKENQSIFLFGTSFWIFALVCSFFVLFPTKFSANNESPSSIKRAYQQALHRKRYLLLVSLATYIIGITLFSIPYLSNKKYIEASKKNVGKIDTLVIKDKKLYLIVSEK